MPAPSTTIIATARGADAETEIRELEAGSANASEVAEAVSPSLFGGRRVVVLRSGQDAKKDLVAALLDYARDPDPDVQLVVTHAGGAKGKAFADGLKAAGATMVPATKISRHRERVEFVQGGVRPSGRPLPR